MDFPTDPKACERRWKTVFNSVPALVAVKGVCTDSGWVLFWRYKGDYDPSKGEWKSVPWRDAGM